MSTTEPDSLGRSINDYLNHYIGIADAKAAALVAGALVVAGIGIGSDEVQSGFSAFVKLVAIVSSAIAALLGGAVLYPRTPHSGNGHLFWADIRRFPTAEAYWKSLANLDAEMVGREYARQNYWVSEVLLKKHLFLRIGLVAFGAACCSAAYTLWAP